MKKALLFIFSALLMVLTGCTEGQEKPLQTTTQDKPTEQKVVFTLPEGWKTLEDNPLYAYGPETNYVFQDGKPAPGPADLALQYSQKESPRSAEQMYEEFYEQNMKGCTEYDSNETCLKLLTKETLTIEGVNVYVVHYKGQNFIEGSQSADVFWEKDNVTNQLLLNGDFQQRLPALTTVIQTLHHE